MLTRNVHIPAILGCVFALLPASAMAQRITTMGVLPPLITLEGTQEQSPLVFQSETNQDSSNIAPTGLLAVVTLDNDDTLIGLTRRVGHSIMISNFIETLTVDDSRISSIEYAYD